MSSLRQSPLPTLAALSSSFTDLQIILQPLLSHPYETLNSSLQSKTSGENELQGRLDAARMQVSVAYVLMDLVWILLKTKGVDSTNHPVMQELERVKSYFGKIKRVQEGEKESSEQKGGRVDKSAAGRFIRAALAGEPGGMSGKHTKFDDETKQDGKESSPAKKESNSTGESTPSSKKKRPAMDPFEGYDKPKTLKTPAEKKDGDSAASSPAKKKKKTKSSSK